MKNLWLHCYAKIMLAYLLLVLVFVQNIAAQELSQIANRENSQNISQNKSWAQWLVSQVKTLPSTRAIEQGDKIAGEQQKALQQALYNPELGASYLNNPAKEYYLTLSQSIDLFDKQTVNSELGSVNYDLAKLKIKILMEEKLSSALLAYIEYSMSKNLLQVSKKQEKLLTKLSTDLKLREEAGDVGQIDAEMAYLSLSQNLQQISLIEIRYRRSLSGLQQSLNSSKIVTNASKSVWLNEIKNNDIASNIENNFKNQYAKKLLEQSLSQSKIAQLNKKVNPTLGLGVGREGKDNTFLLEMSVPLYVRNNFSAEYRAALYKVNQSEFELKEQQRLLKNDIEQSLVNYQQLKSRVLSWQKLTRFRLENSQKLLDRQWKSGDISTSDYLFSLRQRTDTLIANIELNGEMRKAWVEWLLASSQVHQWLIKTMAE